MFNWMKSEQENERNSMAEGMNPFMRQKMLDLLKSVLPEDGARPETFDAALGGGHFDNPKLAYMLDLLRRRHAPSGDSAGNMTTVINRDLM